MIVSLILGCGVPPVAAYSLVAIVVIPSLVKMGITPLSAHFFSFYFAIISAITPPVALAAMAGSGIAEGNYAKTGIKAFKLAISGFILPFLIIYNPIFTFDFTDTAWVISSYISLPLCLVALTAVIYNFGLTALSLSERSLALLSSILLFTYAFIGPSKGVWKGYGLLFTGLVLFTVLVIRQYKKRRGMHSSGSVATA
jgi:TRAP-type uncharacterized transport system fused permease subunit